VCNLEPHLPSLTSIGFVEGQRYPFNLRIADIPRHFCFRDTRLNQDNNSCFPFHAACWELYRDYSKSTSIEEDYNILYNVLNSTWYYKGALVWGHDYGGASPFQGYRWRHTDVDSHLLADPRLSLEADLLREHGTGEQSPKDPPSSILNLGRRAINAPDPFWAVPDELISEIFSHLSSVDVLNLRLASAKVALVGLSATFWKSRFLPHHELGFARSLHRPETCTWKSWYLLVKGQCKRGPRRRNLMNRKRIWLLAGHLVELVNTVKERIAFGSSTSILSDWSSRRVTSAPPKYREQGCRELTHRVVTLNSDLMSQLCGLKISSVLIAKQRFVSGLRFIFSSGDSVRIGYVDDRNEEWASFESDALHSNLLLRMILSNEGFKAISLGTSPLRRHSELLMSEDSASAQIPLENLCGLMVGLDVRLPKSPLGLNIF
jgi:F-box domain